MNDIKEFIAEKNKMLQLSKSISTPESEHRAGEFLHAMAILADYRHMLTEEKIKLLTVQTATYAQEMSKGTAKTVTENKLTAEASEEYTKAREALEGLENDLSYLKVVYDIYMAAHVFYRNVAKNEGSL